MKIREWMKKYVPSFKRGAWTAKVPEDQYVIRECEFCSHMKPCKTFINSVEQFCENKDADRYGQPAHDGCIHFKE